MAHNIFIIEDHDWAREALARLLELQPSLHVCGTAASGEEALTRLPAGADLVLVDIGLRGMSGVELLEEVRQRWPDLRCLVLSNQPANMLERVTREAGSMGYVEKGNAPALLDAIHAALDSEPTER